MNLADAIVPGVSLIVGAAVSYFALDKRQAVSEAVKLDGLKEDIAEVKAEHLRSAADQGTRIGSNYTELKNAVGTLFDFKARFEGAAKERRRQDTRGIPVSEESES